MLRLVKSQPMDTGMPAAEVEEGRRSLNNLTTCQRKATTKKESNPTITKKKRSLERLKRPQRKKGVEAGADARVAKTRADLKTKLLEVVEISNTRVAPVERRIIRPRVKVTVEKNSSNSNTASRSTRNSKIRITKRVPSPPIHTSSNSKIPASKTASSVLASAKLSITSSREQERTLHHHIKTTLVQSAIVETNSSGLPPITITSKFLNIIDPKGATNIFLPDCGKINSTIRDSMISFEVAEGNFVAEVVKVEGAGDSHHSNSSSNNIITIINSSNSNSSNSNLNRDVQTLEEGHPVARRLPPREPVRLQARLLGSRR